MSASTGPVLAGVGALIGTNVLINDQPWSAQGRIAVAGAVVAVGLSALERPLPQAAVAFSWLFLAGILLVRTKPNTPSPAETFAAWWQKK